WAPTAFYSTSRLANPGMNCWTFTPNLSYTKLWLKNNLEFDVVAGFDIYTINPATQYTSGTMFRLDMQLLQRTKAGLGYGLIFSWFHQITPDTGGLSGRLNGFEGRALAIGPSFLYKTKLGKSPVEWNFRWIYEFDTQNRPQGNSLMLNLGASF